MTSAHPPVYFIIIIIFKINLFIYLFIFGSVGSSLLHVFFSAAAGGGYSSLP